MMKQPVFLFLVFVLGLSSSLYAENPGRSVGILDLSERSIDGFANRLYCVESIAQTMGFNYTLVRDFQSLDAYPVVIVPSELHHEQGDLTEAEVSLLYEYVSRGGTLIMPRIRDTLLTALFGVLDTVTTSNTHWKMRWKTEIEDAGFRWLDAPEEMELSLGREGATSFNVRNYLPSTGLAIGEYEDMQAAVVRNDYGKGQTYLLGFSFKNLILLPQLNLDPEAQRTFSNGFEPTSDALMLFIKGIVFSKIPHSVSKHTSPGDSSSVLMITHDVDSASGMEGMADFVDLETAYGVPSHYFMTTHYIDDNEATNYFDPFIAEMKDCLAAGMRIGSHSVGHFPDFADETVVPMGSEGMTRETYSPGWHDGGPTAGATVFGELEVSKALLEQSIGMDLVRSFRAGHLAYSDFLPEVLEALAYQFDSSFSANDVLTHFPYFGRYGRSSAGGIAGILEIPVTLSDVFPDNPISEANYMNIVDHWETVILKARGNGAPTVLLIHPNRDYKVWAEQALLDRLAPDLRVMDFNDFGQFWLDRNAIRYSTAHTEKALRIILEDEEPFRANRVSLYVDEGDEIDVALFSASMEPVAFSCTSYDNGILIFAEADKPNLNPDPHLWKTPVSTLDGIRTKSSKITNCLLLLLAPLGAMSLSTLRKLGLRKDRAKKQIC